MNENDRADDRGQANRNQGEPGKDGVMDTDTDTEGNDLAPRSQSQIDLIDDQAREQDDSAQTMREEDVIKWLAKNPDVFRRRSDLLSELEVPHLDRGDASSLIERQVKRLRLELTTMQKRFDQVVESARLAEQQQARVHTMAISLVGANSTDDIKRSVCLSLTTDFEIDHVAVRLKDDIEADDSKAYEMLRERVQQGRSFCDHRLPSQSMAWLFGSATSTIESCAVVPVSNAGEVLGIIGLGDADSGRFGRDMGTVYLDRLGELIGSVVYRLKNDKSNGTDTWTESTA